MKTMIKSLFAGVLLLSVGQANATIVGSSAILKSSSFSSSAAISTYDGYSALTSMISGLLTKGVQISIPFFNTSSTLNISANGSLQGYASSIFRGITIPVISGSINIGIGSHWIPAVPATPSIPVISVPTTPVISTPVSPVPEPSTYALAGLALLGLLISKRRHKV